MTFSSDFQKTKNSAEESGAKRQWHDKTTVGKWSHSVLSIHKVAALILENEWPPFNIRSKFTNDLYHACLSHGFHYAINKPKWYYYTSSKSCGLRWQSCLSFNNGKVTIHCSCYNYVTLLQHIFSRPITFTAVAGASMALIWRWNFLYVVSSTSRS